MSGPRVRVLVSGAGGLVGQALATGLPGGMEVRPLKRKGAGALWWDPQTGQTNASEWHPDALIHLAGESIGAHRWNAEQKAKIAESRVAATERLVRSFLKWKTLPSVFVGASAVGYYGDRAAEELTEQTEPGDDFLAQVCVGWEKAAAPLRDCGVRVVHLRFGMILDGNGGALARMLPIFRLGLGGKLGSGQQWMSWIALDDVVRIIQWTLTHSQVVGAYNAVAPIAVTNEEFTRMIGKVLRRPSLFPVPALVLRFAFGEMADALLLASQRAVPERLLAEGFKFEYPNLEGAFRHELKR